MLGSLFYKGRKADYDKLSEEQQSLVVAEYVPVDRIKDEITVIMKQYPEDRRTIVVKKIADYNDPILWANLIIYARNSAPFLAEILQKFKPILEDQLNSIVEKEQMLHNEFWYIIVFHNCPFIDTRLCQAMSDIINSIRNGAVSNPKYNSLPSLLATVLICDYLQKQSPTGNKPMEIFFNWNGTKSFGEQVTYRTFQRTVFKKYKKNRYGLYTSIT